MKFDLDLCESDPSQPCSFCDESDGEIGSRQTTLGRTRRSCEGLTKPISEHLVLSLSFMEITVLSQTIGNDYSSCRLKYSWSKQSWSFVQQLHCFALLRALKFSEALREAARGKHIQFFSPYYWLPLSENEDWFIFKTWTVVAGFCPVG